MIPWILLEVIGWAYVYLAPYSKVEESFNLHAIHDILLHGTSLQNYDHFLFPGVVPRSFIGSLVLSTPIFLGGQWIRSLLPTKFALQVLVRMALSTINAAGLFRLYQATKVKWGSWTGIMFLLVTCTQFHLMFWMGRTLPNSFALYPVNVASSLLLSKAATPEISRKNFNTAIGLLVFATVVLRAELILLLGPVVLQGLVLGRTTLLAVIKMGLLAGLLSLLLTLFVDSYLWNQWPLWPELAGQYFNVYQGKSEEWGVSPFHTYFTAHLPKLLLTGLPLAVLGLIVDSQVRSVVAPYFGFMLLLSFHGHKEWRFIMYAVPVWNIAAGRGAAWLFKGSIRRPWKSVLRLMLLGCFGLNILTTIFLMRVSMANYPGGHALNRFNEAVKSRDLTGDRIISVHIDNLAAQTGASLFLQEHSLPSLKRSTTNPLQSKVIYSKIENLINEEDFEGFDWLITEQPSLFLTGNSTGKWKLWDSVDGLERIELYSLGTLKVLRIPRIIQQPKLWLLTRT